LVSDLKVNLLKSSIGGVGIDLFAVQGFAAIINFDVMKTPFKYFGMPVESVIRGKPFGMVWLKKLNLDWENGKIDTKFIFNINLFLRFI